MVESQNGTSKSRWYLLAGAASLAAAATGYLVYGYATGWKGPAYSFWCPQKREKAQLRSSFHAVVDQESKTLDIDARSWMERYVKKKIKKGGASRKP